MSFFILAFVGIVPHIVDASSALKLGGVILIFR